MEKLLAVSILGSTPADISGAAAWMMMGSSLFKKKADGSGDPALSSQQGREEFGADDSKQQRPRQDGHGSSRPRPSARTWFAAPEFDGLNCFETIVSH